MFTILIMIGFPLASSLYASSAVSISWMPSRSRSLDDAVFLPSQSPEMTFMCRSSVRWRTTSSAASNTLPLRQNLGVKPKSTEYSVTPSSSSPRYQTRLMSSPVSFRATAIRLPIVNSFLNYHKQFGVYACILHQWHVPM